MKSNGESKRELEQELELNGELGLKRKKWGCDGTSNAEQGEVDSNLRVK
jgi:hypothetical protein